jgi:hypothetical protein
MDAGLEQVEFQVGTCARFGPGGSIYADDGLIHFPRPNNYKMVYALSARHPSYSNVNGLQAGRLGCVGVERKFSCSEGRGALVNKYNFETGIWSNDQGEKYKNGNRVE